MEEALQRITDQATALHEKGAALSEAGAAFRTAHGAAGMPLCAVQAHALARYSAALARYAAARLRRDADAIREAVRPLARHAVVLDRVRPLSKAARPAIDALLQRAARDRAEKALDHEDRAAARPRARPDPGNLVIDGEDGSRRVNDEDEVQESEREDELSRGSEEGHEGSEEPAEPLYRPPKIAEVIYDGEREILEEREARIREKMAARAARSRSVKEMLVEVSGRPEELRDDEVDESAFAGREIARLRRIEEERTRYEEENLTRLNITREDRKRRRILSTTAERSGAADDPAGDAFADLMGVADRVIGKGPNGGAAQKAGQDRVDALDAFDRGLGGKPRGLRKSEKKKRSGSRPGKKHRKR